MIIGVGLDVVGIKRFRKSLEVAPNLIEKLFVPSERDLPVRSLAARFAAKEALAKPLGAPKGIGWHDAWVVKNPGGRPHIEVRGTVAQRCQELGVHHLHVSLSHDAGVAMATVIAEGNPPASAAVAT
jgi:holo-[acyl-carrier protein] synthase